MKGEGLMDQPDCSPHVLMFPLPSQGDLHPMLKIAELLCLANLKVTFVNTTYNHQRMTRHNNIEVYFSQYPDFGFETIPDGLPDDHPRSGDNWLFELLDGLRSNGTPLLRERLLGLGSAHSSRITCLIADTLLTFVSDIASEAGVAVIKFKGTSACFMWTTFCVTKLIEAGEIPIKDNEDMDDLVTSVPGMTGFLRRRDLPSFYRMNNERTVQTIEYLIKALKTHAAHPIILNTFEELEGPVLSQLQSYYTQIYSVGPLHAHLRRKLGLEEPTLTNSPGMLWEADQSSISWLDQKPDKSVVYVSFGSLTNLTTNQFMEFWTGLVQSNKYFLWVVRPNMVSGSDPDTSPTTKELLEGTKERGHMVGWAPQEAVLAHRAVGGFLTHSGWNSTLESIIAGVPMLCWPFLGDQHVNSRCVSEVWKIGLDMKDTCDRHVMEKMVNDLMDGKTRAELNRSMATMSDLAKRSISEGGSSYCNLERLIADIKAMSKKAAQ